ncbi:MAG: desulfoferrodoxin [Oscillospiraceae bacterium]|nr:desulfoferrodoxin [Oscillospiraceae bacterium]
MRKNQTFFICETCQNLIGLIEDHGIPLVCCGADMTELVPNTVEASQEKHLPALTMDGDTLAVDVGSVPHPMEAAHHISFIYVETEKGGQRKGLEIGSVPTAKFAFVGDKPLAVYAYCNLHGMWKTEV